MKNKYTYYKEIQSNHGYGWDTECAYETDSQFCFKSREDRNEFEENMRAYRENCAAPIRVVKKRELNNAQAG